MLNDTLVSQSFREKTTNKNNVDDNDNTPGGDAAEDSVEVVAAEWEEHSRRRCPELCSMVVALAVCVDEMTNLWQQLFDQHGLIQT